MQATGGKSPMPLIVEETRSAQIATVLGGSEHFCSCKPTNDLERSARRTAMRGGYYDVATIKFGESDNFRAEDTRTQFAVSQ